MVSNAADALRDDWRYLIPSILVCANAMARPVCAKDKAQRYAFSRRLCHVFLTNDFPFPGNLLYFKAFHHMKHIPSRLSSAGFFQPSEPQKSRYCR